MNRENLSIIIENYINQFDKLKKGEIYKGGAIQHFQRHWNVEADDFGTMFKNSVSETYNMISNKYVQPTSGIIELAKYENDRVREMFINLFADDGGDLASRQDRIDEFVSRVDDMLQKYAAGKWKFKQDVRTAISYLCLRYPDENYIYKATPARTFAKYIDFGNDIEGGRHFKLSIYYQMCDQIVEVILQHQDLLDINSTRFDDKTWPDTKHHLLASDIIFCAVNYSLFGDIVPPNPSKKKIVERSKSDKMTKLISEIDKLESELHVIQEVKDELGSINLVGVNVKHKKFGCGEIVSHDNKTITVKFDSYSKIFCLPEVFTNKYMVAGSSHIMNYYEELEELINNQRKLERNKLLAEAELKTL